MLHGAVPLATWSSSAVNNPETKAGRVWKELQARKIVISRIKALIISFRATLYGRGCSKQLRTIYN